MPQALKKLEERVAALEQKVAQYEGSTEFLIDQIRGVHLRLIQFETDSRERDERMEHKLDTITTAVARTIREELAKRK